MVDLFIEDDGEYSVADILVASDDHFASTAAENIRQEGVAYLKSHKDQYTTSIQVCLKDRVKAQNTDLLTYALTILAPKGWEKTEDAPFGYEALDSLSTRFKAPLEKAEVDCSVLQEEWDDMPGDISILSGKSTKLCGAALLSPHRQWSCR